MTTDLWHRKAKLDPSGTVLKSEADERRRTQPLRGMV
jgi:hypothetical protein